MVDTENQIKVSVQRKLPPIFYIFTDLDSQRAEVIGVTPINFNDSKITGPQYFSNRF